MYALLGKTTTHLLCKLFTCKLYLNGLVYPNKNCMKVISYFRNLKKASFARYCDTAYLTVSECLFLIKSHREVSKL